MNSESGEPSHGEQAGRGKIALRLYVVRSAPNSVRAISNLRAIGREWFKDGYDLEIVDVLEAPHRALEDDVIVTADARQAVAPPDRHRRQSERYPDGARGFGA